VEYLVIQNAPEEQVFVYILKDYFSSTFVRVEFVDGCFESVFWNQTLFKEVEAEDRSRVIVYLQEFIG